MRPVSLNPTSTVSSIGEPSDAPKRAAPADVLVIFGPEMAPAYADDFRHDAMCSGVDLEMLRDGTAPIELEAIVKLMDSGRIGPDTQVVLQCHGGNDDGRGFVLKVGGRDEWVSTEQLIDLLRKGGSGMRAQAPARWKGNVFVAARQHTMMPLENQRGPVVVHGTWDFVTEIGNEAVSALIGHVGECKRTGSKVEAQAVLVTAARASAERIRFFEPGLQRPVVDTQLKWMVQAFIDNGANVNAQNAAGDTPLHVAARRQNPEIPKLLLDVKADPAVRNNKGQTPLDVAKARGTSMADALEKLVASKD